MQEKVRGTETLPMIPLRGVVVLPHMILHFDVARERSVNAVEQAACTNRKLFLVTQRDVFEEDPGEQDLYEVGIVCELRQAIQTQEGAMRVLVEGLYPAKVRSMEMDGECMGATVRRLPVSRKEQHDEPEMSALVRALKAAFERYSQLFPRMPRELVISVMCQDGALKVYEEIAFHMMLDYKDKQQLLEESSLYKRMQLLYDFLCHETMVTELQKNISEQAQENLDEGQREYFLREQMRIISGMLQEENGGDGSESDYVQRIMDLKLPEECTEKLMKEASRLSQMPPASQEAYVITSYLDTVLELPWHTQSEECCDLQKAEEALEADHYGLAKVKERILESLAVHVLKPDLKGQVLCLVGPPGVGKSSIAKSIAAALDRKFVRVSLGGVRDEADIRGHRKTYLGAMPGRIIAALQQAHTNDPLILLDELDKMGNDYKGDPSAAMLEVLDSEQNAAFRDHYIELPFDLSRVLFVATANTLDTIPAPLLDRMEIIEITSYTREEKFQIAKRHLVAKQLKAHGLEQTMCRFDNETLYAMIDQYTKEAGVRQLERTIAAVCRKAAKAVASGKRRRIRVKQQDLQKYLGIPKYLPDAQSTENTVGLVNGLAWTSVGGVLMPLEALVLEGTGKIEITGSLGNVMQESARLAVSYARSVAKDYGIAADFYQKKDIHIHAPEGAVPKDGPSAGVTMATALISALSGIPVRADVAMTGEITLHGRVMPIGGLREKSMAAFKAGIRTVLIPEGNAADLEEVDEVVRKHVKFIPVKHLSQVLDVALVKPKRSRTEKKQKPASAVCA